MSITFELSDAAGRMLRQAWGNDLPRAAFEALVIEGYRTDKLTSAEVGRLLGLADRWSVDRWLAERQVPLNYSRADLEADRRTLDEVLGGERS